MIQVQDNDEAFPAASQVWSTLDMPTGTMTCPTKGTHVNGYVYNINLSNLSLGALTDATKAIIVADGNMQSGVNTRAPSSFNCAANANFIIGPATNSVGYVAGDYVARHAGLFNASYVDGHVSATTLVPEEDIDWSGSLTNAMPTYTEYTPDQPHAGSIVTSLAMPATNWAHAISRQNITDGTFQFEFANPADMNQVKVGFSSTPIAVETDMDNNSYGFHLMGGMVMILPGMQTPSDATFTGNDLFAIQRSGSLVTYYKNGKPIFNLTMPANPGPLPIHAFLEGMDANGSATNISCAMISGAIQ